MEVYADILVLLNLIVDYFLLSLTSKLLKTGSPVWRQLAAAAIGGLSSLVIFLPELNTAVEILLRAAICAAVSLTAFGFRSPRFFLRTVAVFFAVSFGFAGAMLGIWQLFRPNGLIIRNSAVYLGISPLFLIVFSVIAYFITLAARQLLGRKGETAEKCEISVYIDGDFASFTAITDTGNSLEDAFGNSEVIVADPAAAEALLGRQSDGELAKRYRVLPCGTVGGTGLLEGYRCDRARITCREKTTELSRPILAISKTSLGGDYSAVINPKIIE